MRAERLPDRTEAKVAPASTKVPPAVASEETTTQLVIDSWYERILSNAGRQHHINFQLIELFPFFAP
jgi:hypothetical protein